MGRIYEEELDGRVFACRHCHCHLARHDDIISKQFHCKSGKAYLFEYVLVSLAMYICPLTGHPNPTETN